MRNERKLKGRILHESDLYLQRHASIHVKLNRFQIRNSGKSIPKLFHQLILFTFKNPDLKMSMVLLRLLSPDSKAIKPFRLSKSANVEANTLILNLRKGLCLITICK